MATTETFTVLSIPEAVDRAREEADEAPERTYVQVRRDLDIGSFGVNAISADGGKELVAERSAVGYARDGHEELFLVLSGSAAFTVDDATLDAPAGTAVFVRDVDAKRAARAKEDGTTLLVVGGRRGEAWRPTPGEAMQEFFPLYEAKDYEGALRVAEQVLEEYPGNGLAHFNIACMHSLLGHVDEAFEHLGEALVAAPPLIENAQTDEDFAAIREDPRFAELVPSDGVKQEA
jgi:tetratricopeptide (TPR) repeat protein